MKPVTELDTRGPGLRRAIAEAESALPGAEARARQYHDAGRTGNPDYAASASAAYGLAEATVVASARLLSQLDGTEPYWAVALPRALGEEGVSPVLCAGDCLYARYPSGRLVQLRGQASDLRDHAILQVEGEDGRSLGSGWIRRSQGEARPAR